VPLYGVYNVVYFIKGHDTISQVETDSIPWKQLVIDGGNWKQSGIIEYATGKKLFCNVHADTINNILKMQSQADTLKNYLLHYATPNENEILLKGRWEKDSIEVLMNKYDLDNYLLHREKFTWINE
jgi:hypothetical protein